MNLKKFKSDTQPVKNVLNPLNKIKSEGNNIINNKLNEVKNNMEHHKPEDVSNGWSFARPFSSFVEDEPQKPSAVTFNQQDIQVKEFNPQAQSIENEATKNDSIFNFDHTHKSVENPMLWEEQSNKPQEEDDEEIDRIMDSWQERDQIESKENQLSTPRQLGTTREVDFDDFMTPNRSPGYGRDTTPRRSAYVRRSVHNRNTHSQAGNPFERYEDDQDFRYNLRGDTQVLFSLLDIDSKHIELFHKGARNITIEEEHKKTETVNAPKFELESISECCKFISHKYKNHKEKRKQNQILRLVNKENSGDNESTRHKWDQLGFMNREYPGVTTKNYLKGKSQLGF